MSLIQAEKLTKVYGQGDTAITALDHVNLSVDAGECVAVMGPSGCGKNLGAAKAKARDWLQKVGLGDRLDSRPDQLSGGQQQRVAVARALVADPKLILADEPTGNLDSKASGEIAELLRQISKEWGCAVVMVTHDPRIAAYADRIVHLKDGAIVEETRNSH